VEQLRTATDVITDIFPTPSQFYELAIAPALVGFIDQAKQSTAKYNCILYGFF
jgi:hypothetical protein